MNEENPNISGEQKTAETENNIPTQETPDKPQRSGGYYYSPKDESELKKNSVNRTLLTAIAFVLQIIVLTLPQDGLKYATEKYQSYAFAYMWIVFGTVIFSVFLIIKDCTSYKLLKRTPTERAPRGGFGRRTYWATEVYMVVNLLMLALEISFLCMDFDVFGLVGVLLCALALAASIWARMIEFLTMRNAEFISMPDGAENNSTTSD